MCIRRDVVQACDDGYHINGDIGLAAWEARISLVLTMGCGVRHFLTACYFRYLEMQHL